MEIDLDEGLATVAEASEYLSVCKSYVWRLMQNGELTYTSIGRARRIPRSSLKALAAKGLNLGRN